MNVRLIVCAIAGLALLGPVPAIARQHVVIVLDDSGSMAESMATARGRLPKIDVARDALLTVMQQMSDDAEVGVLALNSRSRDSEWVIPLGPLDRTRLATAVQQIRASGGTPLGVAMKRASDALLLRRQQVRFGTFRLLIVSDGEAQDADLVDRFLPEIKGRGLTVDVIGVAMRQDHSLANEVDRYRAADDESALVEALRESLAETPPAVNDPSAELDFELLQALPDEMAMTVIETLASFENEPIGRGTLERDASQPRLPTSGGPPGTPPYAAPQRPGSFRIVAIAIFVVLMLAFKTMVRSAKHRR